MSDQDREQLRKWLNETESDSESILGVEDPDEEEENILLDNQLSELDDSEDEENEESQAAFQPPLPAEVEEEAMQLDAGPQHPDLDLREFYIGREKGKNSEPTHWYLHSQFSRTSRTPRMNITYHAPGPQGDAKTARTPLDALTCLIDNEMIELIVRSTNIYIDK